MTPAPLSGGPETPPRGGEIALGRLVTEMMRAAVVQKLKASLPSEILDNLDGK